MKQAIATVKKTKEIQEKYKVFTKKSFGQNFLQSILLLTFRLIPIRMPNWKA